MKDLGQITGQKAVVCRAKKSVANFKLRQGTPIGCKVTLRGERMYEFVDRFFNVALPRVRDFRGINGNGFDGRGNFACGIKEQIIFPEIDFDKVDAVRGMDVCFVTTAKTDEEGKELLKALALRSLPRITKEEIDTMAKLSMKLKQSRPAKSLPVHTPAAASAAAPTPCCASTACAVCASVSWPTRARSRA